MGMERAPSPSCQPMAFPHPLLKSSLHAHSKSFLLCGVTMGGVPWGLCRAGCESWGVCAPWGACTKGIKQDTCHLLLNLPHQPEHLLYPILVLPVLIPWRMVQINCPGHTHVASGFPALEPTTR